MFIPENILENDFDPKYNEFYELIKDLLNLDEVRKLSNYEQHIGTSRLDHSLYVSYYAYKFAKKYNLDYKSSARAGLLHDLFLYDWRDVKNSEGSHAFAHPKIALRNAREITVLNKVECDCIAKHMWPLCALPPKYYESYVVSFADKYSATIEVFVGIKLLAKNKLLPNKI